MMPSIMSQNWINVKPGDPAFSISTNICEYFELGRRDGADYWLEGQIVGGAEFIFNGRIFVPGISGAGTVIDNFPKGPTPQGWTKRQRADGQGYDLFADGKTLFGYRVVPVPIPGRGATSALCFVTANLYTAAGQTVAESLA